MKCFGDDIHSRPVVLGFCEFVIHWGVNILTTADQEFEDRDDSSEDI